MVRIPPIRWKKDVFYNGKEQTPEDRKGEAKYTSKTIPTGCGRAVKRAAIARGVPKDIGLSLKDSVVIMPQVLTMISAIGVSAMIIAEYTPIFTWLGYIFQPLLMVCQVPDAAAIAPSMPVGLAEMFLPVLVMNGTAATVAISYQARCIRVPCFHGTDHLLLGDSNSHAGYQVADQVLGTAGMLP